MEVNAKSAQYTAKEGKKANEWMRKKNNREWHDKKWLAEKDKSMQIKLPAQCRVYLNAMTSAVATHDKWNQRGTFNGQRQRERETCSHLSIFPAIKLFNEIPVFREEKRIHNYSSRFFVLLSVAAKEKPASLETWQRLYKNEIHRFRSAWKRRKEKNRFNSSSTNSSTAHEFHNNNNESEWN